MKIAVISDSHYYDTSVSAVGKYLKDVDVLIHCGDGVLDLKKICVDFNGDVYGVNGNCDITSEYPLERIIEVLGRKIFVCHGHRYNVKSEYNSIYYKAKEIGADIVLFGHSHKGVVIKHDGVIMMNPGSISLPYAGVDKSLGFIEIFKDQEIKAYLNYFKVV